MTAEHISTYVSDPNLYNANLGDVQGLPNENMLVTFCTSGRLDEVAPDGTLVRRMNFGLGGATGYTIWKETLYESD